MIMRNSVTSLRTSKQSNKGIMKKLRTEIKSKSGNTSMKYHKTSIDLQEKPLQLKSTKISINRRSSCNKNSKDKKNSLRINKRCWKMRKLLWRIELSSYKKKMRRFLQWRIAIRQELYNTNHSMTNFMKNTGNSTTIMKSLQSSSRSWSVKTKR